VSSQARLQRSVPLVVVLAAALLSTACAEGPDDKATEEAATEPTPSAEMREDPYTRVRAIDPSFTVRSTLKVNPCDGRFMDLVEEQTGLAWDESPTSMDGIVGGKAFTKCTFKSAETAVLVIAQGVDFDVMEPNLEPRNSRDLPGAYWWAVGERRAVVRPVDIGSGSCDVGLETSFGYMSFSGGRPRHGQSGDSCATIETFVERLEPPLWD